MSDDHGFEIKDSSGLTDADWAEINKLREAAKRGTRAVKSAIAALSADPVMYVRVMGAFFPDDIREAIRDEMAESGMTAEDLRELIAKLEGSQKKH
jgi:hypothetical protein